MTHFKGSLQCDELEVYDYRCMMYSDLLTYGDFIQLKNSCNSKELLEEIKTLNGNNTI